MIFDFSKTSGEEWDEISDELIQFKSNIGNISLKSCDGGKTKKENMKRSAKAQQGGAAGRPPPRRMKRKIAGNIIITGVRNNKSKLKLLYEIVFFYG